MLDRESTYIVAWKTLTNEIKLVHESEQHGLLIDVIPPHVVDQLLLQDTRRLQPGPQVAVCAPLQYVKALNFAYLLDQYQ